MANRDGRRKQMRRRRAAKIGNAAATAAAAAPATAAPATAAPAAAAAPATAAPATEAPAAAALATESHVDVNIPKGKGRLLGSGQGSKVLIAILMIILAVALKTYFPVLILAVVGLIQWSGKRPLLTEKARTLPMKSAITKEVAALQKQCREVEQKAIQRMKNPS
jgi:hypothetical protein